MTVKYFIALFPSVQDCHRRAWDAVSKFLSENTGVFAGKSVEAESTVMPASRSWIREMTHELGNSADDHCVVLILNCPSIGIISATRMNFILNYVSNVLADYPLNSICFLVHPNRAGQQEGRTDYLWWLWVTTNFRYKNALLGMLTLQTCSLLVCVD